jgi:hypothetical protein
VAINHEARDSSRFSVSIERCPKGFSISFGEFLTCLYIFTRAAEAVDVGLISGMGDGSALSA